MCQFTSWYFDDNGYVIECKDCAHFRVCFGNVVLTLDHAAFKALFAWVCLRKETHTSLCDVHTKSILIATPCSSIQLMLSECELNELYNMLQQADTEMRIQQLLDLFNA